MTLQTRNAIVTGSNQAIRDRRSSRLALRPSLFRRGGADHGSQLFDRWRLDRL